MAHKTGKYLEELIAWIQRSIHEKALVIPNPSIEKLCEGLEPNREKIRRSIMFNGILEPPNLMCSEMMELRIKSQKLKWKLISILKNNNTLFMYRDFERLSLMNQLQKWQPQI